MTTTDPHAEEDRATITAGRNFEQEYRLDAAEAGEFLIAVGEQLRDDEELTLTDDEWELPFAFGEPVALEIDFDGVDQPELEIELDIPGRTDEKAPNVGVESRNRLRPHSSPSPASIPSISTYSRSNVTMRPTVSSSCVCPP
ncbi:MAG: amphi-Trp domain-containing protein [Natronomonas sp.]